MIKRRSSSDLTQAVECLRRLNRVGEFDAFIEKVILAHKDNGLLLFAAAEDYRVVDHQGSIVAGSFVRGPHRGGTARYVNAYERDRVRALQLMVQAMGADEGREAGRAVLLLAGEHAARQPRLRRGLAPAVPDRPGQAAGLRGGLLLRRRPRHRRAGQRRRHAGLLPCARELEGCAERRRALALGAPHGRRGRAGDDRAGRDDLRRFPPLAVRHGDARRVPLVLRPRDRRRRAQGRKRHLRAPDARRGRDHRAARHRHQALQAARTSSITS